MGLQFEKLTINDFVDHVPLFNYQIFHPEVSPTSTKLKIDVKGGFHQKNLYILLVWPRLVALDLLCCTQNSVSEPFVPVSIAQLFMIN